MSKELLLDATVCCQECGQAHLFKDSALICAECFSNKPQRKPRFSEREESFLVNCREFFDRCMNWSAMAVNHKRHELLKDVDSLYPWVKDGGSS